MVNINQPASFFLNLLIKDFNFKKERICWHLTVLLAVI